MSQDRSEKIFSYIAVLEDGGGRQGGPGRTPALNRRMTSLGLNVSLMVKKHHKALVRILILSLLFTGIGAFILWDIHRVNRDFLELKTLLSNVRYEAITGKKMLIARFGSKDVVVRDKNTGKIAKRLSIPTLNEVNYDTTLGDKMIVFYMPIRLPPKVSFEHSKRKDIEFLLNRSNMI